MQDTNARDAVEGAEFVGVEIVDGALLDTSSRCRARFWRFHEAREVLARGAKTVFVDVDGDDAYGARVEHPVGITTHSAADIHAPLTGEAREVRRSYPALELTLRLWQDLRVRGPFIAEAIWRPAQDLRVGRGVGH